MRKQSLTDRLDNDLMDVPLIISEEEGNGEEVIESVIANVLWQMSTDRKTTALKQFQGNVWRFGYESGDIKGQYVLHSMHFQILVLQIFSIYSDVPKAMALWKQELGIKVCIYSSGSILAQKLLFGHSIAGDLTNVRQ